jgi:hypothetical protein
MLKTCSQCGTQSESAGAFCTSCGGSLAQQQAATPQIISNTEFSAQIKGNANPAFVWSCVAVGGVGAISTFLPYMKDDYGSVSGWDSSSILSDYEQFSSGTIMIMLFSIAVLIAGLMHFSGSGSHQKAKTQGWSSIVVGFFCFGAAQATYSGWDAAAKEEGVYVETGLGLYLGYLVGIGIMVIGILCLVLPNFHRKESV